jgi:hypothetical protein
MSNLIKINTALLSIIGSAIATGVFVTWIASAKAADIDTAKADINELKTADRLKAETLSRLDERTGMILKQLETLNAKFKP